MPATSSNVNVTIRLDKNLKAQSEALFEQLGLNLSTAVNMFLRQAVRENGLPFQPSLGAPEEKHATEESSDKPDDLDAALASLRKELV